MPSKGKAKAPAAPAPELIDGAAMRRDVLGVFMGHMGEYIMKMGLLLKENLDVASATHRLENEFPFKKEEEEDGKNKGKRKRTKDPNRPKRPPSAYLLHNQAYRPQITKENPSFGPQDTMRALSEHWKGLNDTARAEFTTAAQELKEKHIEAVAEYEEKKSSSSSSSSSSSGASGKAPPKKKAKKAAAADSAAEQPKKKKKTPKKDKKKKKKKKKTPKKDE